jgi:hypothetical protein
LKKFNLEETKMSNTIKDLLNNEEIVRHIVEDLDDFAENAPVTYEVWAIGYDSEDSVTEAESFFASFDDPDEAIEYARRITLSDIIHMTSGEIETEFEISYISVEVETVVEEDEESYNVGTIFKTPVWVSDEEGPNEEYRNIIKFDNDAYELLEDGSIKVSCDVLKDFNKNDTIQIMYVEEDNQPIMTYKIISKTTDNCFICEFVY